MDVRNIRQIRTKPLADFYHGECFLLYDTGRDEDTVMMATGKEGEGHNSNLRAALDLYTGEYSYLLDTDLYVQVVVDIIDFGR